MVVARRRASVAVSIFIASAVWGEPAWAAEETGKATQPAPASALVMLDYQSIKLDGYPSMDLLGIHVLNKFNDWLYVGVGAHAPLFKGEYGGFMAFDSTVHAERRLFGNWSASVGASLGGGGGGKSSEQSRIISGSGGFAKAYVGVGYQLDGFSIGLNYSRLRFTNSVIDSSQFGVFVQAPFSYRVASYENAGRRSKATPESESPADNDVLIVGLDNLVQIKPKGSFQKTVNLVDAQYNHFLSDNYYVLFGGSVGYHGLVGYNQAYGGAGYKYSPSNRINVNAQLALGSGGYAPERFDTGPGLLVFPKVSAEYLVSDKLGVLLSGGYLYAPRGTSRNFTLGAALVYHPSGSRNHGFGATSSGGDAVQDTVFNGYRVHLFAQNEFHAKFRGAKLDNLKLSSVQIDKVFSDNVYMPFQGSIASSNYHGFPGYGEVLAGIGVQSKYSPDDSFQPYAQLLVGTNVDGGIIKPAVGFNFALSERFAVYGQLGAVSSLEKLGLAPKDRPFRAATVALGLSYRFSLPDR